MVTPSLFISGPFCHPQLPTWTPTIQLPSTPLSLASPAPGIFPPAKEREGSVLLLPDSPPHPQPIASSSPLPPFLFLPLP